jgi:hypothetical protein
MENINRKKKTFKFTIFGALNFRIRKNRVLAGTFKK